jgi:phosphodiesterase/alkaline phosphatase D-like protein
VDQEKGRVKITNGPVLENLKSDTATIAWSTNLKSTTEVSYGPKPDHLSEGEQLPPDGKGLMHRFQIKGLQPNTKYYFRVRSRNPEMPNSDSSKVLSFTTPALGADARHNELPQ